MLPDVGAQLWPARCLNDFQNDARRALALPALQNALYRSFRDSRIANTRATVLVHVAGLRSDVGLIGLADAAHFLKRPLAHRETNAVKHEPAGFLRHA